MSVCGKHEIIITEQILVLKRHGISFVLSKLKSTGTKVFGSHATHLATPLWLELQFKIDSPRVIGS